MNDHACILIWDAHTRMGHNIGPYAYGISHTRMARPIRVWANIRIWGRTAIYSLQNSTGGCHKGSAWQVAWCPASGYTKIYKSTSWHSQLRVRGKSARQENVSGGDRFSQGRTGIPIRWDIFFLGYSVR